MIVNVIDTIFVISMAVFLCVFLLVKKTHKYDNILLMFTIFSPIFFSALGIVYSEFNNSRYIFSYILYLFSLFFTVFVGIKSNKKYKLSDDLETNLKKNEKIFNILGWIALILQLTILIYPNFKLFDLFKPFKSNYSFNSSEYFSMRLLKRSDPLLHILSIARTSFLPFFFILLYNHRHNSKFVIPLYLFYYYISYINEYYIQRNKIVLMFIFILIYLWTENKIKEKALKRYIIALIPITVCIVGFLGSYRTNYTGANISINEGIEKTIYGEAYTQSHISLCDSISSQLSFPKMVLSIVTAPFFFLPNIDFPTLAYLFTEELIGLSYGAHDYYIVLPCSYGEAVMMFGATFSFMYGIFLGICVSLFYNCFKGIEHAKYFLLFVILNYAACFRGSVQSFLLQTVNLSFSFILISLSVGLIRKKNEC